MGSAPAQTGDTEIKISFKADVDSAPDVSYIAFANTILIDALFLELDTVIAVDATPKQWQPVVQITNGDVYDTPPQIKMDAAGNAIAIWAESDPIGGDIRIRAKRYNASLGSWEGTVFVDSATTITSYLDPQINMDAAGNAIVVWGGGQVFMNRYNATNHTWGTPAQLGNNLIDSGKFAFKMNGDGIMVRNGENKIYARFYTSVNNSWGDEINIANHNASELKIDIDNIGDVAVMWSQTESISVYPYKHTDIWANYFNVKNGNWSDAVLIENSNVDGLGNVNIRLDANGNAIAVWNDTIIDFNTGKLISNVYINHYSASSKSWGGASSMTENGTSGTSQIAFDAVGNAIVIWAQKDISGDYDIWAKRYKASTASWGTPESIETVGKYNFRPQICFNSAGNAVASWLKHDGTRYNIVASVLK
jgi:hypothetical protein